MPEIENSDARRALVEALLEAVRLPNEIDYAALITLVGPAASEETPNPDHMILEAAGGNKPGREVSVDLVHHIVEVRARDYRRSPFSLFVIDPKDQNIVGLLPIWRARSEEDEQKFRGCFILYVSATPQGRTVFNAAIQRLGETHKKLARTYLGFGQ